MNSIKATFRGGACILALMLGAVQASAEQGPGAPAPITLTFDQGTNFSVAPSPDFKNMVIDLHGVLWIMPTTGGKAQPITQWQLEASRPVWSPKGDLIAFQAFGSGSFHIWTVRPDGSELTQITTGLLSDNREPAWSPDGTRIAFASDRANEGSYDIWTVDLKTKALDRKTNAASEESEPVWSADGLRIAFVQDGHEISAIDGKGVRTSIVPKVEGTLSAAEGWRPGLSLLSAAGRDSRSYNPHGQRRRAVERRRYIPLPPAFFARWSNALHGRWRDQAARRHRRRNQGDCFRSCGVRCQS